MSTSFSPAVHANQNDDSVFPLSVELQFLATIAQNPHDEFSRHVYADWLEEQGDERCEYLRLEILVHQLTEQSASRELLSQRLQAMAKKCCANWLENISRPIQVGNTASPQTDHFDYLHLYHSFFTPRIVVLRRPLIINSVWFDFHTERRTTLYFPKDMDQIESTSSTLELHRHYRTLFWSLVVEHLQDVCRRSLSQIEQVVNRRMTTELLNWVPLKNAKPLKVTELIPRMLPQHGYQASHPP